MTVTIASAPSRPLTAADVSLGDGFWGAVHERTRDRTEPAMWASLDDPAVSPGVANFRVAAGLRAGTHEGPPFMDGDLYKWLEAAISVLETDPEPALAARVDEVARLVASVQREDGYLHTPTLIAAREAGGAVALSDRFHFETYNLGHLITAGVRHHRVTGSTILLETARRAAGFLEHLAVDEPLDLARSAICPSHYMAVIDLYRATGEERWLDLARAFVAVRDDFRGGDDNQDRLRVLDQRVVAGHAVRANYLYAGLADLVAETGDTALGEVLATLWRDVVDTKLYVTGGCGALYDGASPDGHPWQAEISRIHQAYGRAYQLPHTTAHAESCANIGMMLWSERMLALTGDARYSDVVERIALNVLLAGISLDGTRYLYTNPLRQVRALPWELRRPGDTGQHPVPAPPPSDERVRETYLSCFCCPPNTARTLAQLHERIASRGADGLFLHHYGAGSVRGVDEAGRMLALREESAYPWSGRIRFVVDEAAGALPLHLRVPGWAVGATLSVASEPAVAVDAGTYARIEREWRAGDEIVLELPMPARLLRAHRLAEEATNQVAVQRGPIVYCLESHDLPEGVLLEQAALRRGATFAEVPMRIEGVDVVGLETLIEVLPAAADPDALYDDLVDDAPVTASVRLVPYFAWGNRGPGEMSVWLPLVW